jgi:hypothetical protein
MEVTMTYRSDVASDVGLIGPTSRLPKRARLLATKNLEIEPAGSPPGFAI